MKKVIENHTIPRTAADWAIRLDEYDLSHKERREFAEWLTASPQHIEELLNSVSTLSALDEICKESDLSVDDLLASASGVQNVTTLHWGEQTPRPQTKPNVLRNKSLVLAASAMIGFLVFSSMVLVSVIDPPASRHDQARYTTIIGEQRSIPLPDGSIVHLNTQTDIALHFRQDERVVELITGEALFDVASEPGRPFRVIANGYIAEAVGTKFNVFLDAGIVNVAVIEGVVAFNGNRGVRSSLPTANINIDETISSQEIETMDDGRLKLEAGHMVEVKQEIGTAELSATNQEQVTSWRERNLIFESDSLPTIIAEFNRYNRRQIILAGDDFTHQKFSGMFHADDPDAFIEFLRLYGQISVETRPDDTVFLRVSNQ